MEGNYGAWSNTTLADLGYVLQLGHGIDPCPYASNDRIRPLQLFDLNGQHTVHASFCECDGSNADQVGMLLDMQLYPATDDLPRVAFTFRLLKHFVMSQFEMTCGAASYYNTLALITDAVNTRSLKVCFYLLCFPNTGFY